MSKLFGKESKPLDPVLSSPFLQMFFEPPCDTWSIRMVAHDLQIKNAAMGLRWDESGRANVEMLKISRAAQITSSNADHSYGPANNLSLRLGISPSLEVDVHFSMLRAIPAMLWRIEIKNIGINPIHLVASEMMTAGCVADMKAYRENHGSMAFPAEAEKGAGVRFPSAEPDLAFYANGWQSWSYSGLIEATQSMPGTRLGPIRRTMVDRPGKIPPRGQGRVDSDMFAVLLDRLNPIGVLAGFLSQREAFGSVASSMKREIPSLQLGLNLDRARLDPGESFRSDWACLNFINTLSEDPLSAYLEMVAQENSTRVDSPTPQGWCSWYYYYQKIEALSIKGQIEWAEKNQREIPLHIIQIDDGYQAHIGDWLKTNNQFPGGMAHLAGEIKEAGLEAGLWLAPFIALRNAQVVKQNPDWILRSRFGLPANTGLVWETFGRALDVTHPGVLEHLTNVFTTVVKDWGYSYLKLDFLYTAALAGRRYDPRRTGAQAIYQMLTKIREIVGEETTLVGCGCPLGSGLGIFDVMRIGPDVAPSWTPKYAFLDAFLQKEFDIPSARNAIHNTLTRAPFHRRWWVNDPDCLLIREAESDLSSAEVQTLATVIALSGGAVMVSDDMLALDEERRRWLAQMLPALPGRMRIVDFFEEGRPKLISLDLSGPAGEWRLLAILNWEDQERQFDIHLDDFELDSSLEYHSVDFWNARYESVSERVFSTGPIAAHGVKLIALREACEGPLWVGDTVHISQGLCVKSWDHHEQTTTSVIDCGRRAQGKVWFSLPAPPGSLRLNGVEMDFEQVHHQVYAFSLDIEGSATLAIEQS